MMGSYTATYPTIPPRVDYSLSEQGEEVVALLLPLMDWIAERAGNIVESA